MSAEGGREGVDASRGASAGGAAGGGGRPVRARSGAVAGMWGRGGMTRSWTWAGVQGKGASCVRRSGLVALPAQEGDVVVEMTRRSMLMIFRSSVPAHVVVVHAPTTVRTRDRNLVDG